MKKTIVFFAAILSAASLFAGTEIFYDGGAKTPVRWRHPRKPDQQLEFYSKNDCSQGENSFQWSFVSKKINYNDLNLLRPNKNIPAKIVCRLKNTGEECLFSFKLVDNAGVQWVSEKKFLPKGMEKAGDFTFELNKFKIASWSKKKGEKIAAPFSLSVVINGVVPNTAYCIEIIRVSGEE